MRHEREKETNLADHCGRDRPDYCALCLCVELIFMFLGRAIPQQGQASQSGVSSSLEQVPEESQTAQGPSFCPFCGEGLTSSFQWGQYCPWCGEKVEN